MEIFYVSTLHTLHTPQLRLSPPRNLIINPLSLLWDKLLPDQIGINRRISAEGGEQEEVVVVVVGVHTVTRGAVRGVAVTGDTRHRAGCVQWSGRCHDVTMSRCPRVSGDLVTWQQLA